MNNKKPIKLLLGGHLLVAGLWLSWVGMSWLLVLNIASHDFVNYVVWLILLFVCVGASVGANVNAPVD